MRAIPSSTELLSVVSHYLRETLAPQLSPADKFYTLVAANAVEIVLRELELGDAADARAKARLGDLLSEKDGDLADLNKALSRAIANGDIALDDRPLRSHLIATALDEAAIDQPRHASIERMRGVSAG